MCGADGGARYETVIPSGDVRYGRINERAQQRYIARVYLVVEHACMYSVASEDSQGHNWVT